jgi:gamma-glutamyltranspeptidase/glutathione hydrolase
VEPARRPRDRFAVASENATGVEVARDVLERGGNAVDATVSGLLVACAAHASSCGLGGGGVALVQPAGSDAYVVDFREVAPHGIRRADHLSKTPPPNRRGVMIGVPGLVAGLAKMHERGGKLPWRRPSPGARSGCATTTAHVASS